MVRTPLLIKCAHFMATVPASSGLTRVKCLNCCSMEARNNIQDVCVGERECVCVFNKILICVSFFFSYLMNLSYSHRAGARHLPAHCVVEFMFCLLERGAS